MIYPDITDDFFIGVLTAQGTAYILQVINRDAFINFGNQFLTEEKIGDFMERIYFKKYGISTNNSKQANEKAFLKMMHELGAGVSLAGTSYSTNPLTPTSPDLFNNLQKKTYNEITGNVDTTNCN